MKRDVTNRHDVTCVLLAVLFFVTGCGKSQDRSRREDLLDIIGATDSVQTEQRVSTIQDRISESRANAITRAVADVSPAVVGIRTEVVRRVRQRDPFWDFFLPREYLQRAEGLGSGFIISPDGYVLTNEHVIQDASKIVITIVGGKEYEAKVVGNDPMSDVALLKIDGDDLPYIPMGNSDEIIIGEWVIALGNPYGLFDVSTKPTVTVGVVSATEMDFRGSMQISGRSYVDMIQTDASINQGNSGGPLVNSLGECIGINTVIMTGGQYSEGSIGIGFAMPINRVKRILPDLRTIGRVDRSFRTGLEVEDISWMAARMLGISQRDGVIVSRVGSDSPAEKAGLKELDVIVAIDGTRIRSTTDVRKIINNLDVTETKSLMLQVFREGKLFKVELKIEK